MAHPHLTDQFDNLRRADAFGQFNLTDGYSIVPLVSSRWSTAKRRMLFVIESMDSHDIKRGRMFASDQDSRGVEQNAMIATFRNVLEQSWLLYSEYRGTNTLTDESLPDPDFAIAVVNFNAIRYFNLDGVQRHNALNSCTRRCLAIIEKLRPTDTVIFGDTAAKFLLPKHPAAAFLPKVRGVPYPDVSVGKVTCTVTTTLDLEPLYNGMSGGADDEDDEDEGDKDASAAADLLYFVCRSLTHAFNGEHLHSLAHVLPVVRVVDTRAKFDAFYEKLLAHPVDRPLGFDTETASLEAYANRFLSHQYAFSAKAAYFIPLRHKDTPFDERDLKYIERKLTEFWSLAHPDERRIIVGTNLQFDLKVVRAQFRIPVVYHTMWDVTAGEQLLDENLALFDRIKWRIGSERVKTTMGNLAAICASYGNTYYETAPFGKQDRATYEHVPIMTHVGAQRYACQDAQICVALYNAQHARAERIRITRRHCYDTWFHTHVANQMSNTVHGISHMHQDGSPMDVEYLDFLAGDTSPLIGVKKTVEQKLRATPAVKALDRLLLKKSGASSGGLFGGVVSEPPSLFQITKPAHKLMLFFDVLRLKSVAQTTTGQPSVGKPFFAAYRLLYEEVDLLEQWQKATKLLGTYVKGWRSKMQQRADCLLDGALRPSFGFFMVLTGRLNSFDPSLQQVPTHGVNAKYVKRAFVAPIGMLSVAWDFSAAEVRKAACLSFDPGLSAAFRVGQELRQKFIQANTKEEADALEKRIAQEGDVHIVNVKRFFGLLVDKKHPLRQAIKAVVFGVIYGKSAKTLANDLKLEAEARHKKITLALEQEIASLEKQLKALS